MTTHGIDLSVFLKMVGDLTKPMKDAESKVKASTDRMKRDMRLSLKLAGVGAVAQGIKMATSSMVGNVTESYKKVQRASGELRSLGMTDMQAIISEGQKLQSTYVGLTAEAFTRAAYDIKSGVSSLTDEGVAAMTSSALTVAKATKGVPEEMTSLFATSYGIFKKQFSEMSDADWGDMFGAALSKSVQQFKTDGAKMQQAIESAGAGATNLGVSMTEQMTLLGMMQQQMQAGEAGTALRAFATNAARAHEAFDKLSQDADNPIKVRILDENGQMRSMPDILSDLKARYGETLDAFEAAEIKEAFGTDEAMKLINALYGQEEAVRANAVALEDAAKQGAKFTEGMATEVDNYDGAKWDLFIQKLDVTKQKIGAGLLPALDKLAPILTNFVEKFSNFVTDHPNLVAAISGIIVGLMGLSMVVAPLAFTMSSIVGLFGGLRHAALLTKVALRGSGSSVGLLAKSLGGLKKAIGATKPVRWGRLVPKLKWHSYIPRFSWLGRLPKLSWRLLVTPLKWTSRLIPGIGWATLLLPLVWKHFIKRIGWDKYLPSIDWSRIWGAFSWDGWLPEVNWSDFMSAISWPDWVSEFKWADIIGVLDIRNWLNFKWLDVLPDWDWGSIIPDMPDLKGMFSDVNETIDVRLENRATTTFGEWKEGVELVDQYRQGLIDLEGIKARVATKANSEEGWFRAYDVERAQDMLDLLNEISAVEPKPQITSPETLAEATRAAEALSTRFPEINAAADTTLQKVQQAVADIGPALDNLDLSARGLQLGEGLKNALLLKVTAMSLGVKERLDGMRGSMSESWAEMTSDAKSSGAQLMNGLINGIQSRQKAVLSTISTLATQIRSEFKSAMDIRSPSRVFMGFGAYLSQGLAIGISKEQNAVFASMDRIRQGLAQPLRATAALGLAGVAATASASPSLGVADLDVANAQTGGAGKQVIIEYKPSYVIEITGEGGQDIEEKIRRALQDHDREFKLELERYLND